MVLGGAGIVRVFRNFKKGTPLSPRKSICLFIENRCSFSFSSSIGAAKDTLCPVGLVKCRVQSLPGSDICVRPRLSHYGQRGIVGLTPRTAHCNGASLLAVTRTEQHPWKLTFGADRLYQSHSAMTRQKKICIVGSGNWGSAIARIIGYNATRHDIFDDTVTMYVYEEILDGKKLTDIINETHENIKYLPGYKIPSNVVAIADLVEAAQDADILVFVVPHQFIHKICSTLLGKIKPTAFGLSLIKGFERVEGGGIELISHVISRLLRIQVSVLMGANIASEVAAEKFCETTVGCRDKEMAPVFQNLILTESFRVVVVDDVETVEVCGALKNIVAVGAGFVDGLDLGDNTKAAVIRLGLMEMIKFVELFYPGSKLSTFFESCGVADLITTCYGGRNRRIAEAFVKSRKTFEELEDDLLNGQKLQGPITAEEVNFMLKTKNMEDQFPLMTAIHKICVGQLKAEELIEAIREHPEHM